MIGLVMDYDRSSAYQEGVSNIQSFANGLRDYMKRNFDEESSVKGVKIEGRDPGSRYIKITFPNLGSITTQCVELHDEMILKEEKLRRELVDLYEKTGFRLR